MGENLKGSSDEKLHLKSDPMKREVASNTMTFAEAKSYCENLGKKLPIPSSADRIEEFKNAIFRAGIELTFELTINYLS